LNRRKKSKKEEFRFFGSSSALNIAVGDSLPSAKLFTGFPDGTFDSAERAKGKKMIIVGLPGAFTPT